MTLFAASTHPGLKRSHNEDCYEAEPNLGLWLVADGVGGHANGEVASAIVRATIKADLTAGGELVDAITHAHAAVIEEIRSRGNNNNMGSTVVALMLRNDRYEIAWVGDSRAYLFDGKLRQLSRDHSPVSDMLASGAITAEQAAHHPERHILSQSLGISATTAITPGRVTGRLRPGQQILLCSDGLTDELNDTAIRDVLRQHHDPESQVDALVNAALGSGGNDNVTVVLVGSSGTTRQAKKTVDPDMETTQNIGDAVRSNSTRRSSHDTTIWLLLALLVIAAAIWLL